MCDDDELSTDYDGMAEDFMNDESEPTIFVCTNKECIHASFPCILISDLVCEPNKCPIGYDVEYEDLRDLESEYTRNILMNIIDIGGKIHGIDPIPNDEEEDD